MTDARPIDLGIGGAAVRAFAPDDFDAVLRLWETGFGLRYPLRADVLELTLAADPTTMVRAAVAEVDRRIVGFAFAGAWAGEPRELDALRGRVWLQAVIVAADRRRGGLGGALARAVVEVERAVEVEGAARGSLVQAGGGLHYLWPGVPDDLPDAGPFLEALGFAFDQRVSFDLRGDVSGLRTDERSRQVLAAEGVTVVPATNADREALLAFILAEFGAEWWHDTAYFLGAGGNPADELLLRDAAGAIRGFARLHTSGSRPPGWPMFWRAEAPHAGGLGPIGLAEALRGRGLGRAFLVAALDRLRVLGASDVVIDDTTLLGYYSPHGFGQWITYRRAAAPLRPLVAADLRSLSREER